MPARRLLLTLSIFVLVPLLAQTLHVSAAHRFTDVPDNAWFSTSVEEAVNLGVVSGYQDVYGRPTGRFGPENSVTVAEAVKIALESAGYDASLGVGYGHWAAKYLSVATGENFELMRVQNLNIDRPATRAEVASLFADAFNVPRTTVRGNVFTDVSVNTPFVTAIEALADDSVLTGDTDASGNRTGRFRPMSSINRAETVKVAMEARALYGTPGYLFSSASSRSSSSRSTGHCSLQDCGTAPGMPNWQCSDGSLGGPSCERLPDGRCGWLIRQCPAITSSSTSSSRSSSSSSASAQTFLMRYTNTGFQPSFFSVHTGDIVRFRNDSDTNMWVASHPHPTHTDYPELDMHASVAKNGEFLFTFGKTGTWGFHNHLNPNHQGVISVDPR